MESLAHSISSLPGPFLSVYVGHGNRDPSRTTTLRNAFVRQMIKRFRHLRGLIHKSIVEEDVFGLREGSSFKITLLQTPGRRRFAFPRSADKVSAFMEWLRGQIQQDILQVAQITQVGTAVEAAWTNQFIQDSYRRGVVRARSQLTQGGFNVPPLSETGGIGVAMGTPFHIDRVGLLYTRTFNELRGITNAMDQQISRVLAQGMADGLGPNTIARNLNHMISGKGGTLALTDTLGRFIPAERRARVLARTEIIRAHAEAQLQEFQNWGVAGVNVKAEWITAGDNRVCNRCADLEGSIFTIEQARGMLPLHAQCRCAWVPFNVALEEKPNPFTWKETTNYNEIRDQMSDKYKISIPDLRNINPGASTIRQLNIIGRTMGSDVLGRTNLLSNMNRIQWSQLSFSTEIYAGQKVGVLAYYDRAFGMGELVFSPRVLKRTRAALRIGGGTHNVTTDLAGTMRHEYGHHVWHKTLNLDQRTIWNNFYRDSIPVREAERFTGTPSRYFGSRVSKYGGSNAQEAWAETFSAWFSPLYEQGVLRKSLPPEIVRIMEQILGKKTG